MFVFEAEWFCHGEWNHIHTQFLATSEQQVREEIERDSGGPDWKHGCKGECRTRPYSFSKPQEDSLKITLKREVKLPLELPIFI